MTQRVLSDSVVVGYASCVALSCAALLVSGVFVTLPTTAVLEQLGVGRLPDGDRALFDPGAMLLLEGLRVGRARITSGVASSAMMAVLTTLTIVPVTAAVMVRLNRDPIDERPWLARALPRVPTFLMLGGITILARASVLVLMAFSSAWIHDALLVASGPRTAQLTLVGGGLVSLVAIGVIGGCQDLARAVAVARHACGWDALWGGLMLARRHPLQCSLPWFAAASGTVGAALVVAWVTAVLGLGRPGAWRPLAEFLLAHVAVALALLVRIWWFDRALRLARRPPSVLAP